MKIYTKTGDTGDTGLFGGDRVTKDAPRIEAYGAVDELNSHIGIIRALRPSKKIDQVLRRIQSDLFVLGADLATRKANKRSLIPRISRSHIASVEKTIDSFQLSLRPAEGVYSSRRNSCRFPPSLRTDSMPARRTFDSSPLPLGGDQRECSCVSQSSFGPLIRTRSLRKSRGKEKRNGVEESFFETMSREC
jgi:hypothetical protein